MTIKTFEHNWIFNINLNFYSFQSLIKSSEINIQSGKNLFYQNQEIPRLKICNDEICYSRPYANSKTGNHCQKNQSKSTRKARPWWVSSAPFSSPFRLNTSSIIECLLSKHVGILLNYLFSCHFTICSYLFQATAKWQLMW